MKRKTVARGFTLIEILVVVTIIALLISILLPSLSRAREQARSTLCRANMKQIMGGQLMYATDFKVLAATQSVFYVNGLERSPAVPGCWPMVREANPKRTNWVWDGAAAGGSAYSGREDPRFIQDTPRRGTIFKYTKDEKLYLCPSDKPGEPNETPMGGGGNGRNSFSMNAYLGYKNPDRMYLKNAINVGRGAMRSKRYSPAEMFVLVEEHPFWSKNKQLEGNFNTNVDRIVTRHLVSMGSGNGATVGRTNIGYLDGRVDGLLLTWETDADKLFSRISFPMDVKANRLEFVPTLQRGPF